MIMERYNSNKNDPASLSYDIDFMKHLANIMYVWVHDHKHITPKFQLIDFTRTNETRDYTLKLRELITHKTYILISLNGGLTLKIPGEDPECYDLRMISQYSNAGIKIYETAEIRSDKYNEVRGIY